ncbi:hypothetical protein [Streptomyces sp. NPDC050560]|uniref:hypothetical protein n=1 Tax=Streptomyces sp. NPDC050560 TaxID=3365630 RepID=UPI0037A5B973
MNRPLSLDAFLATDPRDVGCERAMEILHVYADLTLAGSDPESRYPGMAAHLRACGPCAEDFDDLLEAVTAAPATAPGRNAENGDGDGDEGGDGRHANR